MTVLGIDPGARIRPREFFRPWRSEVQGKITPRIKALMTVIPAGSEGVDLCTLTGQAATIEQGVQALLTVGREQMLAEMEFTDRERRLPAAAWALAEAGGRDELASAAEAAYQALGPGGHFLAAASQHASVLRDAGLIVTRRQGHGVLHVLTPLGIELLDAG